MKFADEGIILIFITLIVPESCQWRSAEFFKYNRNTSWLISVLIFFSMSFRHTLCSSGVPVMFELDKNTNSLTWMFLSLRFCGGLILDVKRKLPFFASDFYDALNIQSLSAILFIYLGTVTNAITFGGLLGDATENMQVAPSPPPTHFILSYLIKWQFMLLLEALWSVSG